MIKIEEDCTAAKNKLYVEYGLSQAICKVGDIIKKDDDIVLVDKIRAYKALGLPMPIYHGIQLKKDLTPRKDEKRGIIYGNERVELIKKGEDENK